MGRADAALLYAPPDELGGLDTETLLTEAPVAVLPASHPLARPRHHSASNRRPHGRSDTTSTWPAALRAHRLDRDGYDNGPSRVPASTLKTALIYSPATTLTALPGAEQRLVTGRSSAMLRPPPYQGARREKAAPNDNSVGAQAVGQPGETQPDQIGRIRERASHGFDHWELSVSAGWLGTACARDLYR
jgi:DNA-binding transcriptional LysR family regulator